MRTIAKLGICSLAVTAEYAKSWWIAIPLKPKVSSHCPAPTVGITVPQFLAMYRSTIVRMVDAQEFKGRLFATSTHTATLSFEGLSFEGCAFESCVICFTTCCKFWRAHGTECPILSVALKRTVGTYGQEPLSYTLLATRASCFSMIGRNISQQPADPMHPAHP